MIPNRQRLACLRNPAGPRIVTAFVASIPLLFGALSGLAEDAPEKLEPGASCVAGGCHAAIAQQPHIHWPEISEPGQCQRCHTPDADLHDFDTDDSPEFCLGCHETLRQRIASERVQHEALEDGCLDCHDPHGGSQQAMLLDAKGENLKPLCFNCHETDILKQEHKHGPAGLGACNMCHNPHVSKENGLLVASGAELCAGCHEEMAEMIEAAEHVHDPADDDCTDCHDPHSGPQPYMLFAAKRALCDECHDEIVATAEKSAFRHSPTTTEDECLGCHSPHASNTEPMLRKPQRELCLDCHDEPLKAGDGWVKDMAAWLKKHEVWHKPIEENDCTGCHRPHGSRHYRLLKKPFPESFYSSFEASKYGLCFSCHEQTIVTARSTRSLTNFRDGSRNLHFLHVNRKKRGRTCRACHEVHASDHALHVRDRVPYGRWLMPINFKKTEDGGSCAPGCHVQRIYSREAVAEPKQPKGSRGSVTQTGLSRGD